MSIETESAIVLPDPAAIFASALSLWHASQKHADKEKLDLSERYNGMDQFMREIMRIANQFEAWACLHINFSKLEEVWSYLLEDRFGAACLAVLPQSDLANFDDHDCLRVAMRLSLPIILDDKTPVPVDITAFNPVAGSTFKKFQIRTLRHPIEEEDAAVYTWDNDPFDAELGPPHFGLYGVGEDGVLEFIAERLTYAEAVKLARKIAPGIDFPDAP
jgi:hypothetical protein